MTTLEFICLNEDTYKGELWYSTNNETLNEFDKVEFSTSNEDKCLKIIKNSIKALTSQRKLSYKYSFLYEIRIIPKIAEWACERNYSKIVKFLLENHYITDRYFYPYILIKSSFDTPKLYDPLSPIKNEYTYIQNYNDIKALLITVHVKGEVYFTERGTPTHNQDINYALNISSEDNCIRIIRHLYSDIERKAFINKRELYNSSTISEWACMKGYLKLLKFSMARIIGISQYVMNDKYTSGSALRDVCMYTLDRTRYTSGNNTARLDIVKFLILHNEQNGRTFYYKKIPEALLVARTHGHDHIVQYLEEKWNSVRGVIE